MEALRIDETALLEEFRPCIPYDPGPRAIQEAQTLPCDSCHPATRKHCQGPCERYNKYITHGR